MKKVLLYSGGMDSWLIDKIWKPDLKVYVNMHTRYSEEEIKKITDQRDDVQIVDFPLGQWERPDAIIPLRNLYLVMVICNITGNEDVDICLGATAGDRVLDKSYDFVTKTNDLLNYLYQPQWWIPDGKKINVNIDFKDKTKEDLLQMFVDQGGNLEDAFNCSFSCYSPTDDGHECWCRDTLCKPCSRKFISFDAVGFKFPDDVIKNVVTRLDKEIVPKILSGEYGRAKKEEDLIINTVNKYREFIDEK